MNFEVLKAFLLLNEVGSFTKAAELSFQSPQGISYAITCLENELGVSLFERTYRGVVPTQYGELIVEPIKKILELETDINQIIEHAVLNKDVNLNVGIINSLNMTFGPILFDYYHEKMESNKLYIEEYTAPLLNKAIIDGRIDIGFSFDCYPDEGLTSIPLKQEGWCLLCNKNNVLAKKESVTFDDLKNTKIALANHSFTDFDYFTNIFKEREIDPEIMLAFATGDRSVLEFIKQDIGVAICATYVARDLLNDPEFCTIPINEKLASYYSCIVLREGINLKSNVKEFITYIQNHI